jgi:hypothetical protein
MNVGSWLQVSGDHDLSSGFEAAEPSGRVLLGFSQDGRKLPDRGAPERTDRLQRIYPVYIVAVHSDATAR